VESESATLFKDSVRPKCAHTPCDGRDSVRQEATRVLHDLGVGEMSEGGSYSSDRERRHRAREPHSASGQQARTQITLKRATTCGRDGEGSMHSEEG
jgi:hypothetical protein